MNTIVNNQETSTKNSTSLPTEKDTNQKESYLTQLKNGLLFLDFDQTNKEPEYEAIGRMTKKHSIISKKYQYVLDLERALIEARLTSKLLIDVKNSILTEDKLFESEELILYYEGIFLDYIHQIKDKFLRLIWWIIQKEDIEHKIEEPQNISLKNFSSYETTLESIGIKKLMDEWKQDSTNGIAVSLKKRTQHHHFVSNLQYNDDFQKIKMSKSFLSPTSIGFLSEYGKTKMKQIGEDSYKKWRDDVIDKQKSTLDLIDSNLDETAQKLIKHYAFPVEKERQAEIINQYTDQQKKFDIENKASLLKVDPILKGLIDLFVSHTKSFLKNHLISIYLVGSVARGEFIPGSSDINMVVITDINAFDSFPERMDPLINVKFLSENDLLDEKGKKWRFICWSDGILLDGKDFKFNEKDFPKPGTFLTLLLNDGILEKLKELKEEIFELKTPSKKEMRFYSLKVIRIMLDFSFGVAMANKPYYTSSRKEKIQYIKEILPQALTQTTTFEEIYNGNIIYQKDFNMIIDIFLENATKNYNKMVEVAKNALNN